MTRQEIARLVETLGHGARRFYVYALCRKDGTTFYIGKGQGQRVLDHEDEAANEASALKRIKNDPALTPEEKEFKVKECVRLNAKIRAILAEGGEVEKVIIKWGLTESESFMCESALINLFGFARGLTVSDLTNIANGHASDPEKKSVADIKTKARRIGLFMRECALQEKPIEPLRKLKIAFININKFYPLCLDEDESRYNEKVKECVRGIWRIGADTAAQIQYVFALYRQRVVGVYHVSRPARTLAEDRRLGLPDFPHFPEDARRRDWLMSSAKNLQEAKRVLSAADYKELLVAIEEERIRRPAKSAEDVMRKFQFRKYFVLDDNVPENILAYKDTFPTCNGTTDFIRLGRAQFGGPVLNF